MAGTVDVNEVMACKKCAFELSMDVLSVIGDATDSTGPTLVNDIVDH